MPLDRIMDVLGSNATCVCNLRADVIIFSLKTGLVSSVSVPPWSADQSVPTSSLMQGFFVMERPVAEAIKTLCRSKVENNLISKWRKSQNSPDLHRPTCAARRSASIVHEWLSTLHCSSLNRVTCLGKVFEDFPFVPLRKMLRSYILLKKFTRTLVPWC